MSARANDVCVIVAAYNAERTVARALRSALAEAEVTELVLVDDASTDATVATALDTDDGSGRLRIVRQPANHGPAAARNRAIAESTATYVAVLDADDMILPGRFKRLLADPDWDAIADNIAFVVESGADDIPVPAQREDVRRTLTLAQFVDGNVSRADRPRGELGFLKPVIRRAFLDRHGLRYDESLRLGEDYALYVRMLAAGARFVTSEACGYLALERPDSLSGRHRTEDLGALLASDRQMLAAPGLDGDARRALADHARHLAGKHHHRHILDIRRARGRVAAALAAATDLAALPGLVGAVARDKLAPPLPSRPAGEVRYLFG